MALSACGPPVEAPISSTRGGVGGNGAQLERRVRIGAGACADLPTRWTRAAQPARRGAAARAYGRRAGACERGAERADLLDQLAPERRPRS